MLRPLKTCALRLKMKCVHTDTLLPRCVLKHCMTCHVPTLSVDTEVMSPCCECILKQFSALCPFHFLAKGRGCGSVVRGPANTHQLGLIGVNWQKTSK